MRNITEEQFDDLFNLIDNKIDLNASFGGKMFETYGPELAFVQQMAKQNRVVTIIESDEGDEVDDEGYVIANMYYVSGYHVVNRIGYLITESPIDFEFECILD